MNCLESLEVLNGELVRLIIDRFVVDFAQENKIVVLVSLFGWGRSVAARTAKFATDDVTFVSDDSGWIIRMLTFDCEFAPTQCTAVAGTAPE